MEELKIKITVGTCRDYRGGDLLNAIDEVVCYFIAQSELDYEHIASLLRAYADKVAE
jgi:hypothetical protein